MVELADTGLESANSSTNSNANQAKVCVWVQALKPHTHTPIFDALALESALKSADSSSESAVSNTYTPVGM